MNKIYNVGIVGTGDAAFQHYKAIKKSKNLLLKAFYTNNKKRGKSIETVWNVKSYLSLNEMIKSENLDIVVIANYNFKHFEVLKEIIKTDVDILIEKPLSQYFSETKKIIKWSNNYINKISVVFQKRFNTSYIKLKKIISKKLIGEIVMVNLRVFMPRDKKYFSKKKWLLGNQMNGEGIVTHHGIHMLDLVCWIFDKDISNVSSWKSSEIYNMKIEDTCAGFFKFVNGPNVNFCISVCSDISQKSSIEIIGTKNTFLANDFELINTSTNKLLHSKYNDLKKLYNYGDYTNVWEDFINSIYNKKKSITDCSTVLTTHKLIKKIYH